MDASAFSGDLFAPTASIRPFLGFRAVGSAGAQGFPVRLDNGGIASVRFLPTGRVDEWLFALTAPPGTIVGGTLHMLVRHMDEALRDLDVVVTCEQRCAPCGAVTFGGGSLDLTGVLARAGIAATVRESGTTLPARDRPWGDGDFVAAVAQSGVDAIETDIEAGLAEAALVLPEAPGFRVDVLFLSRSIVADVMGVMFDVSDDLPRQACAVFTEVIGDKDVELLRVAAHEIGHCLNLVHPLERPPPVKPPTPEESPRRSLSIMQQAAHYRDGEEAYFRRFAWRFDPPELDALHHAPFDWIAPGGQPFQGDPGSRRAPIEARAQGRFGPLTLELRGPGRGHSIEYGIPLFLEVEFASERRIDGFPAWLLDVKAGLLELRIGRLRGNGAIDPVAFRPLLQRCYAPHSGTLIPGSPLCVNVQLGFGRSGLALADPGRYRIEASLLVPRPGARLPTRLCSAPLEIRVRHPAGHHEEEETDVLLRPGVGAWFAHLCRREHAFPEKDLREIVARRSRDEPDRLDAVPVTLARALAIESSTEADARLLYETSADQRKLAQLFDASTAAATGKWLSKQLKPRKQPNGSPNPKKRSAKPSGRHQH